MVFLTAHATVIATVIKQDGHATVIWTTNEAK